jgi:hypothetical protein
MHLSRSSWILLLVAGCGPIRGGTPSPSCPSDRNIVLSSQEDVARAAGCTAASGLTIRTGATIDVSSMRALQTITGDLTIGPTVGVNEISFLELREIGGSVRVASNGSLRGLFLPRLEKAGRISIEANVSLGTISMPRLAEVAGSILITNDADLELLDLTGLTTVGKELVITDNPKLVLIEAGRLEHAGAIRLDGNRMLPQDQAEALRAKTPPP